MGSFHKGEWERGEVCWERQDDAVARDRIDIFTCVETGVGTECAGCSTVSYYLYSLHFDLIFSPLDGTTPSLGDRTDQYANHVIYYMAPPISFCVPL